MRSLLAFLVLVVAVAGAATGFAQAADPPKGLFLMTDYPSQTVRAGEATTIRMKLNNAGLPPERREEIFKLTSLSSCAG